MSTQTGATLKLLDKKKHKTNNLTFCKVIFKCAFHLREGPLHFAVF